MTNSSLVQILGGTPLLQGCPPAFLTALAEQCRIVQLSMGQPFQRAGQLPPGLPCCWRGVCAACSPNPALPPGTWVSWIRATG